MVLLIRYLYTLVFEEIPFEWFCVKCVRRGYLLRPLVFFLGGCSVVAGAKLTIAATKTPMVACELPEAKWCLGVFFVT